LARFVADHPWRPPAHLGDLLRRAIVSGAHRCVAENGRSAELLEWLDPRDDPAPGLALRAAVEGASGDEAGFARVVRVELRVWGLPPQGVSAARGLLLGALDEAARRGLGAGQVPQRVEVERATWGRPLGERLLPPPSGPWQLRLCSPLSLERALGDTLTICPQALFSSCIARVAALRRRFSLSAGRRLSPPGPAARLSACALRRFSAEVVGRRNPTPVLREGLVGLIELEGPLGDLGAALSWAAELQIGRGLSAGHGHVQLDSRTTASGTVFQAPAWGWSG
jgi:hypothetical protein